MRATSDKSLRLVLSTFKNLREELCHLQDDLGVSPAPHPAAPSWQQEPRAGIPGCGSAGGSGCSVSTSGGWMDTGGFGSSTGSLAFSQPSPVAVDVGSRQFLLFPTPAQVLGTAGNVTALSWKMQSSGRRVGTWAQSKECVQWAVLGWCLFGVFCWLLFKLFLGQTGRAVSRIPVLTTQHKATVCAMYLNPRLSRKLSIFSALKHPYINDYVALYGKNLLKTFSFWL